ncbi:ras GEF [Trametopsis cervina]|nr:ras GEF [Trametopsis cervina]
MATSDRASSRLRHLPKLSIDSSTTYHRSSLSSVSSLSTSTRASFAPSFDSGPSASEDSFWVQCIVDFEPEDPDQLAFRADEVLQVIRMEETGWWAAIRPGELRVGWIPSSYVETLPDDIPFPSQQEQYDEYLRHRKTESLQFTSSSLQSYVGHYGMQHPEQAWDFEHQWRRALDEKPLPPCPDQYDGITVDSHEAHLLSIAQEITFHPPKLTKAYPPSPLVPLPPAPKSAPLQPEGLDAFDRKRSNTLPARPNPHRVSTDPTSSATYQARYIRRRPLFIKDQVSLSRLSVLIESRSVHAIEDCVESPTMVESMQSYLLESRSPPTHRPGKVKQITGDDEAEAIHLAKSVYATLPWFMKSKYGDDRIRVEFDGTVTIASLPALVERLTLEPISENASRQLRHTFLSTFRTLGSASEIFDLLLERYYLDAPPSLTVSELDEWRTRCLSPSQARVLSIFTIWLEEHRMIEDDPPIARRLQDFLGEIIASGGNESQAKQVMKTLERLTFAVPTVPTVPRSTAKPPKKKRTKELKSELCKMDPTTIAEHLCLYEHTFYAKIRPQEWLDWVKVRSGEPVANLLAFCGLHDKVAAWVKQSVLWSDQLNTRADTLDFWIKVAEKCRTMRNFTSMSAITTALSSTVIRRLHLTWAHVGKASHLSSLTQLNDPAGSFHAYRQAQQATDSPCVPFIGMYLTDIVHIHDQYLDEPLVHENSTVPADRLFNIIKRRKWTETLDAALAHQRQQYSYDQDPLIMNLIESNLTISSGIAQTAFWAQSQDIQSVERQRADIRRGLEAAGF